MEPRATGKCGCKPPKNAPTLMFGKYFTGIVPKHPAAEDALAKLSGWQMLGNDQHGDCVAVTWANFRRLVVFMATGQDVYPGMNQVIDIYKTQNPNFPDDDNGMDIQTLLEHLVNIGQVIGFARVDETNVEEVKAALFLYGGLWTGINVLNGNMAQFQANEPFDDDGSSPEGGHSVLTGGYGAGSAGALSGDEKFITWAQETSFTDEFWQNQVNQAWVVIWPEMVSDPAFRNGMDMATFAADYKELTGDDFPELPAIAAESPDSTLFG